MFVLSKKLWAQAFLSLVNGEMQEQLLQISREEPADSSEELELDFNSDSNQSEPPDEYDSEHSE